MFPPIILKMKLIIELQKLWTMPSDGSAISVNILFPRLKGEVWKWNKLVLEDAKICTDFAAVIFFSEKFKFVALEALRLQKETLAALLLYLWQLFS